MSKHRIALMLAIGLLFSSLACVCIPTGFKIPTAIKETATALVGETPIPEVETPTPIPKETVPPSAKGCFDEVPEYPGAKRDKGKEAELEELAKKFGPAAPQIKGEGRVYVTTDPLKEVIRFYEEGMPNRGWERKLALTSDEGGIMLWEKDGFATSFIIGKIEEENLIIIGCNPTEPSSGATSRVYAGPDVSEDGVELTDFSLEGPEAPQVGDTLVVRFTLRNTTGSEMKLAPYGILVGCRDPEGENRDFGHREVTLKPEQAYDFEASTVVDKPGLWQFWPGYYLGHWGPYKWHEIKVEVQK